MPTSSERADLRRSLADEGQQDPVEITPDGTILDGRTRWTLLRELGWLEIDVREWDIPAGQQIAWMIDRAVKRRHLTMKQKKALNDVLRAQVVEVREPSKTTQQRGRTEPLLIGHSQTERAETLGVDLATVKRWETEPLDSANALTSPLPTHALDGRGRPQPLHKAAVPKPMRKGLSRKAPKPKRLPPTWKRHFHQWCRHVLPEDRKYVLEMSEELHTAMALLGITCKEMIA